MRSPLVACGVVVLSSALSGQQAIATVFGPTLGGATGYVVAPAGDMDGDLVPDLLVSSPFAGNGLLQIVSGATRVARDIVNPVTGGWATTTVISSDDMNADGVRDFVIDRGSGLLAYSGASGTLLWQTTGITVRRAVAVGDLDGNGSGDLAVIVYNGNEHLRTLSGSDGSVLPPSHQLVGNTLDLVSIGDIDNDGHAEVARAYAGSIEVFSVAPLSHLRSLAPPCSRLAAADMTGDAVNEILGSDSNSIRVFSATTGALLRTMPTPADGAFAAVGDLDGDGVPDLARVASPGNTGSAVELLSGRTGASLGRWPGTERLHCLTLAAVGDVNGDGFGDLLIGDERATATGLGAQITGGWQLVSGRILASMSQIAVQCAQGPFFPQLGLTRPVLGQQATIEGRDGPPGTFGIVALSCQPAFATNLGVAGCDAWFEVGNWLVLLQPAGTTWQFRVPVPGAPQLAGLAIALQAFYLPTASPIGFDLSNAVWARLGF